MLELPDLRPELSHNIGQATILIARVMAELYGSAEITPLQPLRPFLWGRMSEIAIVVDLPLVARNSLDIGAIARLTTPRADRSRLIRGPVVA